MKLYEACDIGYTMGLNTIGECIRNVEIHATSLFVYDNICDELIELAKDFAATPYEKRDSAVKVIGEARAAEIDRELDEVFAPHPFEDMDGGFMDEDLPF